MNDDLERLIRHAQERKASTIADPDEVRAAIPVRAATLQRRRRRGLLLGGSVAALVAVAVTVPQVLFPHDRTFPGVPASSHPPAPPVTPSDTGVPEATAAAPTDGAGNTPMRYTATWLPTGYKEQQREAYTTWVSRTWAATTADYANFTVSRAAVELSSVPSTMSRMTPPTPQPGTTAPVDVNGVAGVYHDSPGLTEMTVTWPAGPIVLQVRNTDPALTKADVLRIARSVRPDPTVTKLPMRVAWIPTGYVNQGFIFTGNSPAAYTARITINAGMTATNVIASHQFLIDIGQTAAAQSGGTNVMINGHPGRIFGPTQRGGNTDLIVEADLGNGQTLTVTGNWATSTPEIDKNTVLRVARSIEFLGGDTAWIGRTH